MTTSIFAQFIPAKGDLKLIPGECSIAGRQDWIMVKDWSVDAETEASMEGGGTASGRVKPGVFSFSHAFDRTSTYLMQYLTDNMHFKYVILEMARGDGDEDMKVFFRKVMYSVYVSKISTKTEEAGGMTQDVEMTFRQFWSGYRQQNNLGEFGQPKTAEWDSGAMTKVAPDIEGGQKKFA